MHIGRTRSVSGLGALSAACVTGTVLAITLLAAVPAQADTLKFFSGTTGYSGPFNGAGTVYNAIQNDITNCSGGGAGNCSGNTDIIATPQTFIGGVSVSSNTGGVWYDLQPNFAGLGVGPLDGIPSDADQIEGSEILTITFSGNVNLLSIATLFDTGHTPFGTGYPDNTNVAGGSFLLNGVPTTFLAANTGLLGNLVDDVFTFQQMPGQPTFYVSGLTFIAGQCTNCDATPIPGAVWLFGGGLGLVAMLSGRRKRKQKSVWETTTGA